MKKYAEVLSMIKRADALNDIQRGTDAWLAQRDYIQTPAQVEPDPMQYTYQQMQADLNDPTIPEDLKQKIRQRLAEHKEYNSMSNRLSRGWYNALQGARNFFGGTATSPGVSDILQSATQGIVGGLKGAYNKTQLTPVQPRQTAPVESAQPSPVVKAPVKPVVQQSKAPVYTQHRVDQQNKATKVPETDESAPSPHSAGTPHTSTQNKNLIGMTDAQANAFNSRPGMRAVTTASGGKIWVTDNAYTNKPQGTQGIERARQEQRTYAENNPIPTRPKKWQPNNPTANGWSTKDNTRVWQSPNRRQFSSNLRTFYRYGRGRAV